MNIPKLFKGLLFKLVLILSIVMFLVTATLDVFTIPELKDKSISAANFEAEKVATDIARQVQSDISRITTLSITLSLSMDHFQHTKQPRDMVVDYLTDNLLEFPDALATYTLWEPNAYDRKDAQNRNKTAYDDATGRLIPYVSRNSGKITVEPQFDYETPGPGDYYLIPKKTKKLSIIEPYYYPINGVDVLITSVIAPVFNYKKQFVGMAGTDLALAKFQTDIAKLRPLNGYVSLISNKGTYIANGQDVKTLAKPYTDYGQNKMLWKRITKGNYSNVTVNIDGQNYVKYFVPVIFPHIEDKWYVEVTIPEKTILQKYNTVRTEVAIVSILSILAVIIILFFVVRIFITNRLKQTVVGLEQLAVGNFVVELPVKGQDELDELARYFNSMVHNVRNMLNNVKMLSDSVNVSSDKVAQGANESRKAVEVVAASIEEISSGASQQEASIAATAKSIQELSNGVRTVAESSSNVSSNVRDVSEQTQQGAMKMSTAVEQMNDLQLAVHQAEQALEKLVDRARQVNEISVMIADISKQTNLLALNAAIEAARSGEHGRGFAVVAAEVRKLSDQTKEASSQIMTLLGEINMTSNEVLVSMGNGAKKVETSTADVRLSGQLFSNIANSVGQISDQILDISSAAQQMYAGTEAISSTMQQLEQIAREFSANTEHVASVTEEQLASIEEISSLSRHLNESSHELNRNAAKFKVDE